MNLVSLLPMVDSSVRLLGVLFWTAIAYRVWRYPAPHTSFSPLWAIPFFIAAAVYGFWFRRRLFVWAGLASVFGVWSLYQFNIVVPYEVWLKRGMPQRPF